MQVFTLDRLIYQGSGSKPEHNEHRFEYMRAIREEFLTWMRNNRLVGMHARPEIRLHELNTPLQPQAEHRYLQTMCDRLT